jgi:hypothetical protein
MLGARLSRAGVTEGAAVVAVSVIVQNLFSAEYAESTEKLNLKKPPCSVVNQG